MHCRRFLTPLSRREMLLHCANGFGARTGRAVQDDGRAAESADKDPLAPKKPALRREGQERHLSLHGRRPVAGRYLRPQTTPGQGTRKADSVQGRADAVQQHRHICRPVEIQAGWSERHPVSDLFPHVAECVDDLAIVRSMTSNFSEHTNANSSSTTGSGSRDGRASVVGHLWPRQRVPRPAGLHRSRQRHDPAWRPRLLQQRLSPRGPIRAPSSSAGTLWPTSPRGRRKRSGTSWAAPQARSSGVTRRMGHVDGSNRPSPITSWLFGCKPPCRNWDIRQEEATKKLYGFDDRQDPRFRPAVPAGPADGGDGVRFVELFARTRHDRWDQHSNLKLRPRRQRPRRGSSRSRHC